MRTLYWEETVEPGEAFHVVRTIMRNQTGIGCHDHHDFAECFWVDEGEGWHLLNGERTELKKGDLIFIVPSDEHSFGLKGGKLLSIYNIGFPIETFRHIQRRYGEWFGDLLAPDSRGPRLVRMDEAQRQEMLKATRQLSHAPRQPLYFDRFLTNLLCVIAQPIVEATLLDVPDWLQRACREILQPQHFSLGAKALVRLAGRCHEHVARELKKATGMTPTEYVNRVRLNYAAQTLELSEKAIIDIASECGFNSLGHFYQLFRKQFGMPPRLYRLRRHRVLPIADK